MKRIMKSRNIKKKQIYKTHLSPNFEDRGNFFKDKVLEYFSD